MKPIHKKQEPAIFSAWKALANEDWQPSYAILSNPEKKAVKDALMQEQGYICCYCERRLLEKDSHIEHLDPQSEFEAGALDYGNMLCSCQQQLAKGTPLQCGNLKADQILPITPLAPDCASRFTFLGNGEIRPAQMDDEDAKVTIKMLGLDIPVLNARRKAVLEPFLDELLEDSVLSQLLADHLQLNKDGEYGEFWTAVDSVLR